MIGPPPVLILDGNCRSVLGTLHYDIGLPPVGAACDDVLKHTFVSLFGLNTIQMSFPETVQTNIHALEVYTFSVYNE